jgi:beta-lactam-binding protein with PASTA domain
VLAKALHGVIPKLIGWRVDRATRRLDRLGVDVTVVPEDASDSARVVRQSPQPGRAAAPRMEVKLVARHG